MSRTSFPLSLPGFVELKGSLSPDGWKIVGRIYHRH